MMMRGKMTGPRCHVNVAKPLTGTLERKMFDQKRKYENAGDGRSSKQKDQPGQAPCPRVIMKHGEASASSIKQKQMREWWK
jgi:hypothetical protein